MSSIRDKWAFSPVIASIILVAVAVALSIVVAAWVTGFTFQFAQLEDLRVLEDQWGPNCTFVDLTLRNGGTSSIVINSLKVNSEVVDFEKYTQPSQFTVLGNSKISSGITTLDLYYRYSADNSTWTNWTFYETDPDVRNGWSWEFDAENTYGTGYYQFYSIRNVEFEYTTEREIEPPGADAAVFVK